MTRSALVPHLVQRIWEEIEASAGEQADRPNAVRTLEQELRRRPITGARALLSYRFLHEVPETHPTLAQRLAALGAAEVSLLAAEPPSQTAARALLGASHDDALEAATDFWWSQAAEWWQARSAEVEAARARLAELEGSEEAEALYERARLVELISGPLAASPLCERLLREHPDDPFALFVTGKALLEAGDDGGLERLRRAADLEPDAVFSAVQSAHDFLVQQGRFDEAEGWREYAGGYAQVRAIADEERVTVRPSDEVVEHGLAPELVAELVAALTPLPLKRAYLARRRLQQLHEHDPQWILAVERRRAHFRFERKRAAQGTVREVVTAITPLFDSRLWVITGSRYNGLIWRMSRHPTALILGRERFTTRLRRPLRARTVALAILGLFGLLFLVLALLD